MQLMTPLGWRVLKISKKIFVTMELYFSGYVNKVSRVKPSYSTCANVVKLFSPLVSPIFSGKAVAYRSGAHHCNPLVQLEIFA
jgi:hypothetical protein